jgi:tetratricopeptide (TPR) repeat protein
VAVAAVVSYLTAARERDYRELLARGDAALRNDQTFGAIEAYSGAIALRPDSMLAHLRRGETYRRRHDFDDATRDFRMAAALDPSAPRALEEWADLQYDQQRFKRAADLYERRLKLDERAPLVFYKLGLAYYRDRNPDAALAALGQALRLDDRLAEAYYLRGLCLRDRRARNDTGAAIVAFEKAVERAPTLIAAREELADLYAAAGRHNDAIEQLERIAAADAGRPERQVAVGLAHARAARDTGDAISQDRHTRLAILTLGNGLERSPNQAIFYGALGDVWLDVAIARGERVDLRKAIEALERAASAPTATSDVLTAYGRALLADDQLPAADRVLTRAMTLLPVDPQAFLESATVAERLGRLDDARVDLIKYTALAGQDPEFPTRALRIAALSNRLNDPATAVTWLTRAAASAPDDGRITAALVEAQAHLERATTAPAKR